MKILIKHQTTYHYAEDVIFHPHRIMLRPREGHDIQIEHSVLKVTPTNSIHWIRDVYDNCIAVINFLESSSELMVYSELIINHYDTNPFDFCIEENAMKYPFSYDNKTFLELSTLTQVIYENDITSMREWICKFWQVGQSIGTLELIQRINSFIHQTFQYQMRYEPGVQSPELTLFKNSGSCRDFATLLIEVCRCLGLAARFVSGYYMLGGPTVGNGASTHAWAEVYLPGGGWRGFDPTLGILTTSHHVPVAVSRHPEDAMPISGSFIGSGNAFLNMEAFVSVEEKISI